MSLRESRPEIWEPAAYRRLEESRLVCNSSVWQQVTIHRTAVTLSCTTPPKPNLFRLPQSCLDDVTVAMWWAGL